MNRQKNKRTWRHFIQCECVMFNAIYIHTIKLVLQRIQTSLRKQNIANVNSVVTPSHCICMYITDNSQVFITFIYIALQYMRFELRSLPNSKELVKRITNRHQEQLN